MWSGCVLPPAPGIPSFCGGVRRSRLILSTLERFADGIPQPYGNFRVTGKVFRSDSIQFSNQIAVIHLGSMFAHAVDRFGNSKDTDYGHTVLGQTLFEPLTARVALDYRFEFPETVQPDLFLVIPLSYLKVACLFFCRILF